MGGHDAIAQVARIVCEHVDQGHRVLTVVSAMSGVTDMLLKAANTSASGDDLSHVSIIGDIRKRHHETAEQLVHDGEIKRILYDDLDSLLDGLNALCHSIAVLREVTPRGMDLVASFGERLSARLLAAHLRDLGRDSIAIDASDLIVTDDNFQDAAPYPDETRQRVQEYLMPCLNNGTLPIVTGFIGATRKGIITTLGRGGSDYSGAILGAAIDTDELWIYTDVDGVMTADPRIAPTARVIPALSYGEVGELAYFGAKVLHPKTIQPMIERGAPVRVRNTLQPDAPRHVDQTAVGDDHRGDQGGYVDQKCEPGVRRGARHGWRARHRGPHVYGRRQGRDQPAPDLAVLFRTEYLLCDPVRPRRGDAGSDPLRTAPRTRTRRR